MSTHVTPPTRSIITDSTVVPLSSVPVVDVVAGEGVSCQVFVFGKLSPTIRMRTLNRLFMVSLVLTE